MRKIRNLLAVLTISHRAVAPADLRVLQRQLLIVIQAETVANMLRAIGNRPFVVRGWSVDKQATSQFGMPYMSYPFSPEVRRPRHRKVDHEQGIHKPDGDDASDRREQQWSGHCPERNARRSRPLDDEHTRDGEDDILCNGSPAGIATCKRAEATAVVHLAQDDINCRHDSERREQDHS
jgi:hypothetical protein